MGTILLLMNNTFWTRPKLIYQHELIKLHAMCFKANCSYCQDKKISLQRPPPLPCLPGGCHSLDRVPWAWLACAWSRRAFCNTAGTLWPCSYWCLWSLLLPEFWLFRIPEMNSNCDHLCGYGLWDTETITCKIKTEPTDVSSSQKHKISQLHSWPRGYFSNKETFP